MQQTKSTSRYILVALSIILVITAFILIWLNAMKLEQRFGTNLGINSNSKANDQYRQGYLAARAKYQNVCPLLAANDGKTIAGTVQSISGNSLKIKQTIFDTDEIVDDVSDIRTANITSATKITLLTSKSADQINKEMAEFKPTPDKPSTPPSPVVESAIRLTDLKVGDTVLINSDANLRLAPNFNAISINVNR